MGWTPELVEQVRLLVFEGRSTAQIGAVMGVSRNAVIGVCYRKKIQLHRQNGELKVKKVVAPRPVKVLSAPPVKHRPRARLSLALLHEMELSVIEESETACRITELTMGCCHWPLWGNEHVPFSEKFYCGAPIADGKIWCPAHKERAWRPFPSRHGSNVNRLNP